MAYVSVEEQKARSDEIERVMKEASIKATKEKAARGELTKQQIENVKKYSRYDDSREEILRSQRKARNVSVGDSYGTAEEAAKARGEIAKSPEVSNVRVIRSGDRYQVVGHYSGDMKKVTVTRDWRAQAARELEEKGETIIAGAKVTKAELEAADLEKRIKEFRASNKIPDSEKVLTLSVQEAYDTGQLSKKDYERFKNDTSVDILATETGTASAKYLKERWEGKIPVSPGAVPSETFYWAETNVPYMAEDPKILKNIRDASIGLTDADIKELKRETVGQKLINQARSQRVYHGENNPIQWMGEAVVEWGGSVLHGGEILTRPSGRQAISNVIFQRTDETKGEERALLGEVIRGEKSGSIAQFGLVETGKGMVEEITTHPVEFGVKTATTLALGYAVGKGIGQLKAWRTPVTTKSVAGSKVFVSQSGKTATGTTKLITQAGKGGKLGAFKTDVASFFRKTGERIVHGQKEATFKGAHIIKTQKTTGGKVYTSGARTTDITRMTSKTTATTDSYGTLFRAGKLGKVKTSYSFGKTGSRSIYDISYDQPTLLNVGKDNYALVTSKSGVLSYGKAGVFNAGKKVSPSVTVKTNIGSKSINVYQYLDDLQRTSDIKVKYLKGYPIKTKTGTTLGTYTPSEKTIRIGDPSKYAKKGPYSHEQTLRHELGHYLDTDEMIKKGSPTKTQRTIFEDRARAYQTNAKFSKLTFSRRPSVSILKPKPVLTTKGETATATTIYRLGGKIAETGSGSQYLLKTKMGTLPTSKAAEEIAKKAAESAAKTSIARQYQQTIVLPTSRIATSQRGGVTPVVNSPMKLLYEPTKKKVDTDTELDKMLRVSTLTDTTTKTVGKSKLSTKLRVGTVADSKYGTMATDSVITGVVTPQAVTPRMVQRQSDTLLYSTATSLRQKVGHPTPVNQLMLPQNFRAPNLFPPLFGMELERPRKKKKRRPADWWAGVQIHPVRNPIELFGLPAPSKGRRRA